MFLLFVVLVCLGVAFLRGGSLAALGEVRIRFGAVLVAAVLLKAVVYTPLAIQLLGNGTWNRVGHLGIMLVLLAVILANRNLPGFWVIGLGILSNFLVLAANGGSMPVSIAGVERLGLPTDPALFHQQQGWAVILVTEGAHLWFLGDIILTPPFLPGKVLSIGDLLIAAGAFVFFQTVMVGRFWPAGLRISR